MSHHRNLCVLHDISHKTVGAPRNQKVHLLIAGKKLIDLTVLLRLKQTVLRKSRLENRLLNDFKQSTVCRRSFLPAF